MDSDKYSVTNLGACYCNALLRAIVAGQNTAETTMMLASEHSEPHRAQHALVLPVSRKADQRLAAPLEAVDAAIEASEKISIESKHCETLIHRSESQHRRSKTREAISAALTSDRARRRR